MLEPCDLSALWPVPRIITAGHKVPELGVWAELLSNFIFILFLLEDHSYFSFISSEGLQGQRQSKCKIEKLFSSSCALIFYFNLAPKPAQDEKLEGFQRWIRAKLIFVHVPRPQLSPTSSSLIIVKMKILSWRVLSSCRSHTPNTPARPEQFFPSQFSFHRSVHSDPHSWNNFFCKSAGFKQTRAHFRTLNSTISCG